MDYLNWLYDAYEAFKTDVRRQEITTKGNMRFRAAICLDYTEIRIDKDKWDEKFRKEIERVRNERRVVIQVIDSNLN